jgi:hypothetical protein
MLRISLKLSGEERRLEAAEGGEIFESYKMSQPALVISPGVNWITGSTGDWESDKVYALPRWRRKSKTVSISA